MRLFIFVELLADHVLVRENDVYIVEFFYHEVYRQFQVYFSKFRVLGAT